jgi:hypothetical protein
MLPRIPAEPMTAVPSDIAAPNPHVRAVESLVVVAFFFAICILSIVWVLDWLEEIAVPGVRNAVRQLG